MVTFSPEVLLVPTIRQLIGAVAQLLAIRINRQIAGSGELERDAPAVNF